MKSSVLVIVAMLLATAILAPSVMTLASIDESIITTDFNEEEKKEAKEKDLFLDDSFNSITQLEGEKIAISPFYIERVYITSLSIVLPPPESLS